MEEGSRIKFICSVLLVSKEATILFSSASFTIPTKTTDGEYLLHCQQPKAKPVTFHLLRAFIANDTLCILIKKKKISVH